MYAVFATGGQQFKGAAGDKFKVEKLDIEPGNSIDFDVLLVSDGTGNVKIGDPLVKGAKVKVKVLEHGRDKKIMIQKFKRRQNHDKLTGHRQSYTKIEIVEIKA